MINELHQQLLNKKFSAKELTEGYLDRIKKENHDPVSKYGAGLNAFITITEKQALEQAKNVDRIISEGQELPILAGIPMSIKDVIMTQGIRTTAGSKILENYIAPYDATVVKKLKEQGMVMLGKTNCDEFSMGSSTENSAFGPSKNPHDKTRVPGGTSGGSASAVAADLSVYSIGADTGGSIRQPAAFCGVVGLKPTYGSVSRYGLIADASSLDQIGVIGKCVEDVEIVFKMIKGKDSMDSTTVESQILNPKSDPEFNSGLNKSNPRFNPRFNWGGQNPKPKIQKLPITNYQLRNIRIGVPKEYFVKGLDREVEIAVKNAIKKVEKLGAEIVNISLPHTEYSLAVYYIIQPAEASANLARYDGIRYGMSEIGSQKSDVRDLIDYYKKIRAEYLGEEVKRRIIIGTYVLSSGYYDAYYKKAQQVRTLIRQDFEHVFAVKMGFKTHLNNNKRTDNKKVDLLITPTTPTPAFKLGEKTNDPLTMYLQDVFTVPINVAGLPAISTPCGKTSDNLPIGVQLIGPWFEEEVLFRVGRILENVLV